MILSKFFVIPNDCKVCKKHINFWFLNLLIVFNRIDGFPLDNIKDILKYFDFRDTLKGAFLEGANLQKANLFEANLRGTDLQKANLFEANLEGVNLKHAYIQGSCLAWANLKRSNLRGVELCNVDLYQANLEMVRLSLKQRRIAYGRRKEIFN